MQKYPGLLRKHCVTSLKTAAEIGVSMFPYWAYAWVIDQVWGQDGWILAKNEANIQSSWPNKLGQ